MDIGESEILQMYELAAGTMRDSAPILQLPVKKK